MYRFFKTKKGFTLTELLLVVAVVGIIVAIAIPIYNSFTKSAHIRACRVARMEAQKEAETWCKDNRFNSDFKYQISSDGEKGAIVTGDLSADQITLLENNIHGGEIPYCPSCGTFTVVVHPQLNGIPKITVTCDGGNDGEGTHIDRE